MFRSVTASRGLRNCIFTRKLYLFDVNNMVEINRTIGFFPNSLETALRTFFDPIKVMFDFKFGFYFWNKQDHIEARNISSSSGQNGLKPISLHNWSCWIAIPIPITRFYYLSSVSRVNRNQQLTSQQQQHKVIAKARKEKQYISIYWKQKFHLLTLYCMIRFDG